MNDTLTVGLDVQEPGLWSARAAARVGVNNAIMRASYEAYVWVDEDWETQLIALTSSKAGRV